MKIPSLSCLFVLPLLWLVSQEPWRSEWQTVAPPYAGWTAEFPGTAHEGQACLFGERNGTPSLHWYLAKYAGTSFLLAYVDIRASDKSDRPARTLDVLVERWLRDRFAGEPTRTELAHGRIPGREFLSSSSDGEFTRQRVFLAGYRFFLLEVRGAASAVCSAAADRFLDSFRVNQKWLDSYLDHQ